MDDKGVSGNTGRGFEYSVPIVKSYHSSETLSKCVEQLFKIKIFFTNLDTNNNSRKGGDEHYSSLKFKNIFFRRKTGESSCLFALLDSIFYNMESQLH